MGVFTRAQAWSSNFWKELQSIASAVRSALGRGPTPADESECALALQAYRGFSRVLDSLEKPLDTADQAAKHPLVASLLWMSEFACSLGSKTSAVRAMTAFLVLDFCGAIEMQWCKAINDPMKEFKVEDFSIKEASLNKGSFVIGKAGEHRVRLTYDRLGRIIMERETSSNGCRWLVVEVNSGESLSWQSVADLFKERDTSIIDGETNELSIDPSAPKNDTSIEFSLKALLVEKGKRLPLSPCSVTRQVGKEVSHVCRLVLKTAIDEISNLDGRSWQWLPWQTEAFLREIFLSWPSSDHDISARYVILQHRIFDQDVLPAGLERSPRDFVRFVFATLSKLILDGINSSCKALWAPCLHLKSKPPDMDEKEAEEARWLANCSEEAHAAVVQSWNSVAAPLFKSIRDVRKQAETELAQLLRCHAEGQVGPAKDDRFERQRRTNVAQGLTALCAVEHAAVEAGQVLATGSNGTRDVLQNRTKALKEALETAKLKCSTAQKA